MDIQKMLREIRKFRDDRDRKQFHNPKDLVEALSIEVGELMEKFLWRSQEESFDICKNDPEVADELADIFNFLMLFVDASGIDLEKAVLEKIKKNAKKYTLEKSRGMSEKYSKL